MGAKEAVKRWDATQGTIFGWCREGRIDGVGQDERGSPWKILKEAKRLRK